MHQPNSNIVSFYTSVDPWAMMIIDRDTSVTDITMFGSGWFEDITFRTNIIWYKLLMKWYKYPFFFLYW
jgi:hypothetical protein